MKKKGLLSLWLLAILLFGLPAGAFAADDAAPSIQVVSVEVQRKTLDPAAPKDEQEFLAGTGLQAIASLPGKRILGIDHQASQLLEFTDDRGTDLKQGLSGTLVGIAERTRVEEPSKVLFSLGASRLPAKGATRLRAKGTLVVNLAGPLKHVDVSVLQLAGNKPLILGPLRVTLTKSTSGSPPQTDAWLEVEPAGRCLKRIEFFDYAGQRFERPRSIFGSEPILDPETGWDQVLTEEIARKTRVLGIRHTHGFNFSEDKPGRPKLGTVRVYYYEVGETVRLPLDLNVGVGLHGAMAEQAPPARVPPGIEVLGLKVEREVERDGAVSDQAVTVMTLAVDRPGDYLVGLDAAASQVHAFIDSRQTPALPDTLAPRLVDRGSRPKQGTRMVLQVESRYMPAPEAALLELKGVLGVKIATHDTVAEVKRFSKRPSSDLFAPKTKLGPLTLEAMEAFTDDGRPAPRDAKIRVRFDERILKQVEFLDGRNRPFRTRRQGDGVFYKVGDKIGDPNGHLLGSYLETVSDGSLFDNLGTTITGYSIDRIVEGSPATLTVRARYVDQTKTVLVPVDLAVGIGL